MNRYTVVVKNRTRRDDRIVGVNAWVESVARANAIEQMRNEFGWEKTDEVTARVSAVYPDAADKPANVGTKADELLKDIHTALLAGVVLAALIGLGIIALLALLTMRHLGAY